MAKPKQHPDVPTPDQAIERLLAGAKWLFERLAARDLSRRAMRRRVMRLIGHWRRR